MLPIWTGGNGLFLPIPGKGAAPPPPLSPSRLGWFLAELVVGHMAGLARRDQLWFVWGEGEEGT